MEEKTTEKMKFEDWFDVTNVEHLKACRHLYKHGQWPENFKPENVIAGPYLVPTIERKIVNAYLTKMIPEEG